MKLTLLVSDVGRALEEQPNMHAMIQSCAESIVQRLGAKGVHIWSADAGDGGLLAPLSAGAGNQDYGNLVGDRVRGSEIGWIAEHREPLIVNKLDNDPRIGKRDWFERCGIGAFAGFPLGSCGRLLGVMAVLAGRPFTDSAVNTLGIIAAQMALALHGDIVLRAHQETSQALLTLVRQSPASIVCVDRLRRVTQWNPASESLFGWKWEEVVGQTIPITPAAEGIWDRVLESALRGKAFPRIAGTGLRKDGTRVDLHLTATPLLDADGAVRGAMIVASDRSDQKWFELCREVGRQTMPIVGQASDLKGLAGPLLRTICEAFDWACGEIWVADDAGKVLERAGSWHRPGEQLSDFETLSRTMTFQSGSGLPGCVWKQNASVWTADLRGQGELERAAPAGRCGLNHAWGVPIRLSGKTIGAIVFFAGEMREPDPQLTAVLETIAQHIGQFIGRKRTEATLRQTEADFHQTQKMEAVGHLAGGIAHDFNNLLTIILGFSELATDSLEQDSPLRQMIHEIHAAGERAAALTKQLLAFSRKQAMQPAIVDLNRLVKGMERMLQRLIGENIEFVTTLEPLLYRIKADPAQIEQVILNLAVNARDAMAEGGRLHVQTTNVERLPKGLRSGSGLPPGPCVCMTVSDTGCGMDEATLRRAFEPFFTTKEAGKGTGMGLATIHGIVKQSGGHIELQSAPGQGTQFRLYFPRAEERLATDRVDSAARPDLGGTETVLVVEDESLVRDLVCRILKARGYRILEAADGAQAQDICRRRREPIHLLLTDVVMPGMNGIQLARQLTRSNQRLKVLFMSGYTDHKLLAGAEREWAGALLQKPFTSAALTQRVREVLDRDGLDSVRPSL